MTVSNGAYQHHQEEMERQQDLSRQREYSEREREDFFINDSDEDSFIYYLLAAYPCGLLGAFLTFMQLQVTFGYFDTSITWELCALIASMVAGYIVGAVVLTIALYVGITYLFFYGLYHLIQYII